MSPQRSPRAWAMPMATDDPPNSPGEIAVFQAYVDLINAERAAMWARHNTLLVANSLILSALAIAPTHKWADLALLVAGLLISAAWLVITKEGWSAVQQHAAIAGRFTGSCFDRMPNPFAENVYGKAQALIYRLILGVISVFVLMYLCLAVVRLVG
jgi:hypothetical protein